MKVIFQHEDVLSVLCAENDSNNTSTNHDKKKLRSYRDSIAHRKTTFLVVIKMHYKFVFTMMILPLQILWAMRQKKYKVSAFYFVIGNFSGKYKSRFKSIPLAILSPASLVSSYGCKEILAPLL